MAASELAKSLSLTMSEFLKTESGNARGFLLSLKQPTGSYGGNAVLSVSRIEQISIQNRRQAVNKLSASVACGSCCTNVLHEEYSTP